LRLSAMGMILVLAGCQSFEPVGAVPFTPPPSYREWWTRTESCSDRRAQFDQLVWAAVPGSGFQCPSGTCVARWEPPHRIYIAEAYLNHEMVVRHEMLHDILGRPGHPNPPFGAGCPLTWESWYAGKTGRLQPTID
jgi:hypothetical protein